MRERVWVRDELLMRVMRSGDFATPEEAIEVALRELLRRQGLREPSDTLSHPGARDDWDYRADRRESGR